MQFFCKGLVSTESRRPPLRIYVFDDVLFPTIFYMISTKNFFKKIVIFFFKYELKAKER